MHNAEWEEGREAKINKCVQWKNKKVKLSLYLSMVSYKIGCKAPYIPKFDAGVQALLSAPTKKYPLVPIRWARKPIWKWWQRKQSLPCRASNPVVQFLASLLIKLSWLFWERDKEIRNNESKSERERNAPTIFGA